MLANVGHAQTKTVTGSSSAQFNLRTTVSGSGYTVATIGDAPFTTIDFQSVNNVASSAVIDGGGTPALTVNNSGSILSSSSAGIFLSGTAAGSVVNNNGVGSITGATQGILLNAATGSVTNNSTSATGISGGTYGIQLGQGGAVTNNAGATINGSSVASVGIANGLIENFGALTGSGTGSVGALLSAGTPTSNVINHVSSNIIGTSHGVRVNPGAGVTNAGTVTNSGTISGTSTASTIGNGIYFSTAGGSVINNTGAVIVGGGNSGVFMSAPNGGGTSSVQNDGIITGQIHGIQYGTGTSGDSGQVTNTGNGKITGTTGQGVVVFGPSSTTIGNNAGGEIVGAQNGIQLGSGAVGGGGTVTNTGTITGTVTNGVLVTAGAGHVINKTGGVISGGNDGVQYLVNTTSLSDIINSGRITANTHAGAALLNGGTVTNNAGGIIESVAGTVLVSDQQGVVISGASGTVNNSGSITSAQNNGITLANGGAVNNSNTVALIQGQLTGVYIPNGGTLTNTAGTINGVAASGVVGSEGLAVTSSATISGVTNSVRFEGGTNTLELQSGSTTIGTVQMGNGQTSASSDTTTVDSGANIAAVPLFHGGTGTSSLLFNAYVGSAREIQSWQSVQTASGANLSLAGGDVHQSVLFRIDGGTRLGFTTQTGTLTGNVTNAGTLDYSAGNGNAAYVVSGTLTNNGLVRLAGTAVTPGNTVAASSYIGSSGTITFNTFLGADASPSDKLIINGGTGTGTTQLSIANAGGFGALTTGNGILVVDTRGGATTTPTAFALAAPLVAGGYTYTLHRGSVDASAPESWFLRSVPPIASLTVTKSVNGGPVEYSGSFPITLACTLRSTPVAGITPSAVQSVTAGTASTGKITFGNIPQGSTCTVSEGPLPAAPENYAWQAPTYTQTTTIASDGNNAAVVNTLSSSVTVNAVPALTRGNLALLASLAALIGIFSIRKRARC